MDCKHIQLIVLLALFVSCTAPPENKPVQEVSQTPIVAPPVAETVTDEPAAKTVQQTGNSPATYSLSEDNRILSIERPEGTWKFHYNQDKLVSLTGPQTVKLTYDKQLRNITAGEKTLTLKHDSRGRLVEAKGARENLYFDYDSLDLLRSVRRGVAGKTSFDYDKQGQIKYITRGTISTNVYMTNRSLINNFDADDAKLILSYGRDDKLSSLAGKTFGQGLTVSYGPGYPPTEAKIVHQTDNSVFLANSKEELYTIVDHYLYCNYISRYQDLLFDGISYGFYVTYFNNNPSDYLAMQYTCPSFAIAKV